MSARIQRTPGRVAVYRHRSAQVGALVEVTCETESSARRPEFVDFADALALQIAALRARYLDRRDVPLAERKRQRAALLSQAKSRGVDKHRCKRIVDAQLEKWLKTACLLEQPWIRDDRITVDDARRDLAAQLGETITIRAFHRLEIGSQQTP